MDPEISAIEELPQEVKSGTTEKPFLYTKRDWKEYLGESILIVFSVLLALIVTEFLNERHEKETTRNVLKNVVAELQHNKTAIKEVQQYNLLVLTKIDSVLVSKELQDKLVTNDEFQLKMIAPQGALYRFLDDEAWAVVKNSGIITKVDIETIASLTKVYEDQARMMKVEDEVAKVILSRESRDPKQAHATLMLIRDIYHGWAVDRTAGLLERIDSTIKKVETY